MRKKKFIKYSKERAVLSDVLPYEVPITFSNRHFYKFITDNKVTIKEDQLTFQNSLLGEHREGFDILLKILFSQNINPVYSRKIPFTYRISHKDKDFRELALVHPLNQLKLVEFYNKFKDSIIYACSISNFSIRKPTQVATYTYFNDNLHLTRKGQNSDFLELVGKEYENLKTFFVYKKYTNVYRFYEDERYHKAEKKYNHLYRFDITKCFDSIYSHSIVWAILGLETVKENVDYSKKSFGGIFDEFIQQANYGETNGILVGPEFSRIFAEIILQRIDFSVENKLKETGINLNCDYEVFRYVDDYFLFYDDHLIKDKIITVFKHELKNYKLSINNSKTKEYTKPIITEITIAKEKITQLFSKNPQFIIEEEKFTSDADRVSLLIHKCNFSFDSSKLSTQYKIIVKESQVDYKDVLNFSLSILSQKIESNLVLFEKIWKDYIYLEKADCLNKRDLKKKREIEDGFTEHIIKFVDFLFFIYSVSPRVNSTIKTSLILSKIIKFFNSLCKKPDSHLTYKMCEEYNKEKVFKKILAESSAILHKNTLHEYSQVESLYLLTVMKDLGREYRINEIELKRFVNYDFNLNQIRPNSLNYFSIVVSVFYIGNSQKYDSIKQKILNYIFEYIQSYPLEKRGKSSELAHLMLDLLICPFLNDKFKQRLLIVYHNYKGTSQMRLAINDLRKINKFHKIQKFWFTKWERFDLTKELENKKSQEVYS